MPTKFLTAMGIFLALAATSLAGACSSSATTQAESQVQTAVPTEEFLNSIGVVSTFPNRGQPLEKTVEMVRYGGFRWVRGGIEGLTENGPTTVQTFLDLHRETGALISWGLVSGSSDIDKLIRTARPLDEAGALLAFEGNNEPNNWTVTYKGRRGGGRDMSWMPIARLHRDLYQAVSSDPSLSKYPVWSLSETGAQTDNTGLQFLEIPEGAQTLMPAGTKFADYANVHNYIYHPNSRGLADNKVWDASDPTSASRVDGLYKNFGRTWGEGFAGYSDEQLKDLPRVTTETGARVSEQVPERLHGLHLMNLYLAQFKRGYAYTSVYILRDRTDEAGNQRFGFFRPDYSPRKAAIYLHNLTTILADEGSIDAPGQLEYEIVDQPDTVHDLLLQHSDGRFQLVVWGERLQGEDRVAIEFAEPHGTITVYDPTTGVEPVHSLEDASSLELTFSDHPYVIVIQD